MAENRTTPRTGPPRDHMARGQHWPTGELAPGTPVHVRAIQQLACNLESLMQRRGITSDLALAKATGLDRKALARFRAGERVLSPASIAILEHWAQEPLWPGPMPPEAAIQR